MGGRDGAYGDGHRDDIEVVPGSPCDTVVQDCARYRVAQGTIPKVELKKKINTVWT